MSSLSFKLPPLFILFSYTFDLRKNFKSWYSISKEPQTNYYISIPKNLEIKEDNYLKEVENFYDRIPNGSLNYLFPFNNEEEFLETIYWLRDYWEGYYKTFKVKAKDLEDFKNMSFQILDQMPSPKNEFMEKILKEHINTFLTQLSTIPQQF